MSREPMVRSLIALLEEGRFGQYMQNLGVDRDAPLAQCYTTHACSMLTCAGIYNVPNQTKSKRKDMYEQFQIL
jgi:hypothetical protein